MSSNTLKKYILDLYTQNIPGLTGNTYFWIRDKNFITHWGSPEGGVGSSQNCILYFFCISSISPHPNRVTQKEPASTCIYSEMLYRRRNLNLENWYYIGLLVLSPKKHRKRVGGVGGECLARISLHRVPRIGGQVCKYTSYYSPISCKFDKNCSWATGKNDDSRFLSHQEKDITLRAVK